MSNGAAEWWKGTFPTWLVAGLLAILAYLVRDYKIKIETKLDMVSDAMISHKARLDVLDERTANIQTSIQTLQRK